MHFKQNSLWHNQDFLSFWTGETISLFGTQITTLALPLTAVLMLKVTPLQMGILGAADFAPYLFFSLFAGVWIDQTRRRPILIITNIGRAICLSFIPLLAFTHLLNIGYMYAVAFVVGIMNVFFQLAYQAFVPSLIENTQLVEGNSKLNISSSAAEVGGPSLAGILVQVITAPFAIVLDVLSYLCAAIFLIVIRKPEVPPPTSTQKLHIWHNMKAGLQMAWGNRYLRATACEATFYNLFWNVIAAVYVLYIISELHIAPGIYGLILTIGSIGALLGALISASLSSRIGVGRTIIVSMIVACFAPFLIPLAHDNSLWSVACIALAAFFGGIGTITANINVASIRQAVTPNHFQGRISGSYRVVSMGGIPLGSLLGGLLGSSLGLRATIIIGALGMATAWLWVFFSPVSTLQTIPTREEIETIPVPPTGTIPEPAQSA